MVLEMEDWVLNVDLHLQEKCSHNNTDLPLSWGMENLSILTSHELGALELECE